MSPKKPQRIPNSWRPKIKLNLIMEQVLIWHLGGWSVDQAETSNVNGVNVVRACGFTFYDAILRWHVRVHYHDDSWWVCRSDDEVAGLLMRLSDSLNYASGLTFTGYHFTIRRQYELVSYTEHGLNQTPHWSPFHYTSPIRSCQLDWTWTEPDSSLMVLDPG